MNYRHGFHAGNFADVLKHVILMRVLVHLKLKPAPFRVLDTHAGSGLYRLDSEEAQRTGEWQGGIARMAEPFSDGAERVLAPYRAALATLSPEATLYPGSPLLIRDALREQDKAVFNELHPPAQQSLQRVIPKRDARCVLTALDGYTMWKAQIPPVERRGMVLVDPPFEQRDEFARLCDALSLMGQKWPTGSLAIWYPIKDRSSVQRMEQTAIEAPFANLLVVELHVDQLQREGPLSACGLLIANPPFTLVDDLSTLLPELAARLALSDLARYRLDWLRKT
ncbi:ComJ Protein involved in catabolism of external DNA [Rhabdaerophilaceae bacterium]